MLKNKSKKVVTKTVTKRKIKAKMGRSISKSTILYFTVSLSLIAFFCGFKQGKIEKLAAFHATKHISVKAQIHQPPVQIKIHSINIDLPVIESRIVNGEWEVNPEGASHLATSGKPGEKNNIVIYGHNFSSLFGAIRNIQNGDIITVKTADGKIFNYKAIQTRRVEPSKISEVLPTYNEVLTLFTCDGWADTERFVVKAVPIVQNAHVLTSNTLH